MPMTVALLEAGGIVDRAEPEVALHHLARRELDALPRAVHLLVAADVVEPVEQAGDPADPTLGQADAQIRGSAPGSSSTASRPPRTSPSRRTARRWCRPARPTRWSARSTTSPTCRQIDGPGLLARGHERVPAAGVQRRQARAVPGSSGNVTARKPRAALRRISSARQLGVEQPRHLARDDPARVRARPFLEVPVVRGADDGEREVGVAHAELVALAGEPRRATTGS